MLRQLGGCRRPLSPLDLHFTALETKAGEVKLSRGEADPEPLLPDHLMWPKALLCLLTPRLSGCLSSAPCPFIQHTRLQSSPHTRSSCSAFVPDALLFDHFVSFHLYGNPTRWVVLLFHFQGMEAEACPGHTAVERGART